MLHDAGIPLGFGTISTNRAFNLMVHQEEGGAALDKEVYKQSKAEKWMKKVFRISRHVTR